ncbi:MAG: nicotinate-nucleotide adenylyltransferase [Dehalococcoidales bacterium]|nr:nicotinate-nucleotide adenylyltransferase [Dehalococcoidales bacterium]
MKAGILGGTFDPIHNGHLAIAEEARAHLDLSEVLFLPAGQPWMKSDRPITPVIHRAEMVLLALEGRPYFKLSTIEAERQGPSYSVDTLARLKTELGEATELFLVMGWDSLSQLPYWKEPLRLIRMCSLVVVGRPGYKRPDLKSLEVNLPGLSKKVIFLEKPMMDISSTDIRDRVTQGQPIKYLVPPKVAEYIKENRLYRK